MKTAEQKKTDSLTKREMTINISNKLGMVQHEVFSVVQATLDSIVDALADGRTVELRNFGVFQVRVTKPRVGRNPNVEGSRFDIPARTTVKFREGKIMRDRVRKLKAKQ